jgi:hypothetical protein
MRFTKSGDVRFIQQIEDSKFTGFIHSLFDRTINIQCLEDGELYTIANSEMDNGPNTLVIDITSFNGLNLTVSDYVYVENKILHVGEKLAVTVDHVKKWEGVLPNYPNNEELLKKNLEKMKLYLETHGKCGGMKPIENSGNIFEAELTKLLSERSQRLMDEFLNNRMSHALKCAVGLIGLGPGLTPSGDDFLVGFITAINLKNSPGYSYKVFGQHVVNLAKPLTNEISYMALKKASIGRVRESIICLVDSLIKPNEQDLIQALEQVLNIGSSSGTDIAYGLVCGMETNIKVGGRVCL